MLDCLQQTVWLLPEVCFISNTSIIWLPNLPTNHLFLLSSEKTQPLLPFSWEFLWDKPNVLPLSTQPYGASVMSRNIQHSHCCLSEKASSIPLFTSRRVVCHLISQTRRPSGRKVAEHRRDQTPSLKKAKTLCVRSGGATRTTWCQTVTRKREEWKKKCQRFIQHL